LGKETYVEGVCNDRGLLLDTANRVPLSLHKILSRSFNPID